MSTKCAKCSKTVYNIERFEANKTTYHRSCFRCTVCNNALNVATYVSLYGKPYCQPHYLLAKQNPLAAEAVTVQAPKPATTTPYRPQKRAPQTEITGEAYILGVPNEILLYLSTFVASAQDLSRLASSCKTLNTLFQNETVWQRYVGSYGFKQPEQSPSSWKQYFFERARIETKVTVYCGDRSVDIAIDVEQTAGELLKFLCRQFAIYYWKPFKLYKRWTNTPMDSNEVINLGDRKLLWSKSGYNLAVLV